MPEVPLDLIQEVKARTRAAAGLSEYNPSDPMLASLQSLSSTIALSDPSPSDFHCKNCKGRLLGEVESKLCLYCGAKPDRESFLEPICFSSTTGYQWLLHSLQLKGTEMVERTAKPELDEDQNMRTSFTSLSDFLNLKMPWPSSGFTQVVRSSEKQLTENESHLNVNGMTLEKSFLTSKSAVVSDTASEDATVDFGTLDGKDYSRVSGHQKVQSDTSESSSTQKTSQDFEEWEANFQSANSESNHGKDVPPNPFPSTSDGFEDKFDKSVTLDGSRNLDVDLSSHIDSVFGCGDEVNDQRPNHSSGVSTELDSSNLDYLQNLRPYSSNNDGGSDPIISGNHFQKDDNTFDNFKDASSSTDFFPCPDDLQNVRLNVLNTDDSFGAFVSGGHGLKVDDTGDNFKDSSSTADLFPDSDDLQNLWPNVPNTDAGFDASISTNHALKDDSVSDDYRGFSSSDYLFPGSNLRPNVPNDDDGFDAFVSINDGEKDNHTLDSFKVLSSSPDMFQSSDYLQNLNPNTKDEDSFGIFVSKNDGQKDDSTSENFTDFSSSSNALPNLGPNVVNGDDGFDDFLSRNLYQMDDHTLDNFKDFSSADLFSGSNDQPVLPSTVSDSKKKLGGDISFGHLPSTSGDVGDELREFEICEGSRNLEVGFDPLADLGIGKQIDQPAMTATFDYTSKNSSPISNIGVSFDGSMKNSHKDDQSLDNLSTVLSNAVSSPHPQILVFDKTDSEFHDQVQDGTPDEESIDEWSGFVGSTSLGDPPKSAPSESRPSSGHLSSASVGFIDEFLHSDHIVRSKSLDANLGPQIDSVFGLWGDSNDKKGNNSQSNWNLDDMWMNMSSGVTKIAVDFDPFISKQDVQKNSPTVDDSRDIFSQPTSLQQYQSQTTEVANLEMQYPGHDEPVDDFLNDEWNDFMGSTSLHDPPSENNRGIDSSSDLLPSNFMDRTGSLELSLFSDNLPKEGTSQRPTNNATLSPAFGDWNSDDMWKSLNPKASNTAGGSFSNFNSQPTVTENHKNQLHQELEKTMDDENDEWNDFVGPTS